MRPNLSSSVTVFTGMIALVCWHICINLQAQGEILDDIYLASDDYPSSLHEVSHWLAEQMDVVITEEAQPRSGGSKQCSNRRLHTSGYQFKYPSFREGYKSLLLLSF